MAAVSDRIELAKRSVIPARLLRGAEVLGRLWRDEGKPPCGWKAVCDCKSKLEFCAAKLKWVDLAREYYQGDPWGLRGDEPFYMIEAMTNSQFKATGLTALVQVPTSFVEDEHGAVGVKESEIIKIGAQGTDWGTLVDLGSIQNENERWTAVNAVLRIQEAGL